MWLDLNIAFFMIQWLLLFISWAAGERQVTVTDTLKVFSLWRCEHGWCFHSRPDTVSDLCPETNIIKGSIHQIIRRTVHTCVGGGLTRYSNTSVRDFCVWMMSWSVTMLACFRSFSRDTEGENTHVNIQKQTHNATECNTDNFSTTDTAERLLSYTFT